MSDTEQYGGISRRTLVKSSAIGSLALAAGGCHYLLECAPPPLWYNKRYNRLKRKWFGARVP